ncbi:MAG: ComEC/Rec2 family competence protein [Armatimonadota bacterium]|nr:ComEC/Rec2 family competence protein [Armatimonadota bacterium]
MHTRMFYAYRRAITLLSVAVVILGIWLLALSPREKVLEVTFLDVGQGDCIFVRTPSGRTMLVDGGGRADIPEDETIGLRVVTPFIRSVGLNRIDIVVLTHPHEDHVQGLIRVLKDFEIGMVLDLAVPHPSQAYTTFLNVISSRKIDYRKALRGQTIDFGDGVQAKILNPPKLHFEGTGDDLNNNSIVLRLTYGHQSVLLAGDAGIEAEKSMISAGLPLKSTVLKVAHHGSENATSEEWVRAVSPKVAVISAGRNNPFGHPSGNVLRRLEVVGVKVYRTDHGGAIRLKITPSECKVYSFIKDLR